MGNYVSCTLAPPLMKNSKATRVIIPTGEVKQFKEIVKAAELMLEHPNYFLVNSRSLHIGRRFSALGADEELEFGNVYIFFPMRRVNSLVTAPDMAVLFLAANSAAKRLSGSKARVLPDNCGGKTWQQREEEEESSKDESLSVIPRLSLEGVESGFQYRLNYCRSRKPVLETINEEPVRLRRLVGASPLPFAASRKLMHELEEHLVCIGIDQSYTCWTWHGEKRNETADYDMQDSVRNTNPSKELVYHVVIVAILQLAAKLCYIWYDSDRRESYFPRAVDNAKKTDPKAQALKTAMAVIVKSGCQVFKKKTKWTRTLL
ncbi:hypothetical protein D0Y65_028227 [Glycine soja]|uniref:Uncharacterized protein n=2 Tax=Glycine soja TaxID=3848 RepID=A0A445IT85_GLYSO|nr:hypothetical protein D0Y65_028227 [Glycine soja]